MSRVKEWLSPSPLGYIQMCLFILLELLLIFDREFSKFHLYWQFHLYDSLLLLLTLYSTWVFLRRKEITWNWSILVVLVVSLLYLIYSYVAELGPLNYMLRQYALFMYLGCYYIIFYSYTNNESNRFNIRFIVLMGIGAFVLQMGYHIYNLIITEEYVAGLLTEFNYFSLLGSMALFAFEATVLVYVKQWWKWLIMSFLFLLSFTMGHHSSTIICTISVFGGYIFLHSSKPIKLGLIPFALIISVALFKFAPEYFQDTNSLWRLLYWKMTLKDIVLNYYGVLGHGFGVKFTSPELVDAMRSQLNSVWMELRPEEQYLTPMHNSFITISFHIGLLFLVLLFIPLKNVFRYVLSRNSNSPELVKDFLVLSLLGLIVWCNFHVILELPHSSGFFWLVYFTTIHYFRKKDSDSVEAV